MTVSGLSRTTRGMFSYVEYWVFATLVGIALYVVVKRLSKGPKRSINELERPLVALLDRGYNVVLLRDCTTAIEHAETWDGMWLTRCSILDMELRAASVTSEAFVAALEKS